VAASNGRDSIAMCLERPLTNTLDGVPSTSGKAAITTSTSSRSAQESGASDADADASIAEHSESEGDGNGRRRKRRYHVGGARDPGVGVGIVDSANNQDRKLCEVCTSRLF